MYAFAPRRRAVVPHFESGSGEAREFSLFQIARTTVGSPGLPQVSPDIELIRSLHPGKGEETQERARGGR